MGFSRKKIIYSFYCAPRRKLSLYYFIESTRARCEQGPPVPPVYKQSDLHTVDLDEMLEWIDDELTSSVAYAFSSSSQKRLEVRLGGGYVVRHGGSVVYRGTDGKSAVDAYNAIQ